MPGDPTGAHGGPGGEGHNRSPRSSLNRIGDNLHSYASRYLDSIRSKRSSLSHRGSGGGVSSPSSPRSHSPGSGSGTPHLLTFRPRSPHRLSPSHGSSGGGMAVPLGPPVVTSRSLSTSPLPSSVHANPLSMTPTSSSSVWRTPSPNSNWKSDRYTANLTGEAPCAEL